MKIAKIILPIGIFAACVGASVLLVGSQRGEAGAAVDPPPPTVRVARLEPIDWTVEITARGLIEARDEAVIAAEVAGRVVEISPRLEVGTDIEADEWLVSLDPSDFELELERREAAVAQARLALQRQRLELELAIQEWGGDEPTPDEAFSPVNLRRQEVEAAEAALDATLADVAQARLNLKRCRLSAPRPGRVNSRSVAVGAFVRAGEPLASLWQLDRGELRLPIPSDEVPWLPEIDPPGPAPPVLVRPYGDFDEPRWGTLVRRESEIDPRDRVLFVVVSLDDPFRGPDRLEIGTFAEAWIPGTRLRGVFAIPRASLRDADRVLVVEDGRLRSRPVRVVRREGDTAFVADGLSPGDQLCLTPIEIFVEDMAVVPRPTDLPRPTPRVPATASPEPP